MQRVELLGGTLATRKEKISPLLIGNLRTTSELLFTLLKLSS